jgi:hypothetical protein
VDVHLVLLTIRIRINANHQLFALQTLFWTQHWIGCTNGNWYQCITAGRAI